MKTIFKTCFLLFLPLIAFCGATAPPYPEGGKMVAVNGKSLYYQESGQGEPLILLHYFGGSTKSWEPFLAPLTARYRVIAIDMPGHGRSTNPSGKFTHRETARDLLALLDTLGIDRFRAIGMSSGGMTLLLMAVLQPERIEELVLIGATANNSEEARKLCAMASLENNLLGTYEELLEHHAYGDEQIRMLYRQFNEMARVYDDLNLTAAELATVKARTLIVHGDRDEYFPLEYALEMYRNIPDARLWVIPAGTHIPIYDPQIPFTEMALGFLEED